jgi:hypothetical protein
MNTRWVVAKYVSDLRRQEPRNVGVLLWTDEGCFSRFLGERLDGSLDGRRLRWAGSGSTFKAWVAYWRTQVAEGADPDTLLARRGDDSYFLAQGGERLVGSRGLYPRELLDYLFGTLVEEEPERVGPSVVDLAEEVLARTGIKERVHRDVRVELPTDAVTFDYGYNNGRLSYMQRVGLVYDDDRSWDVAHAVAWAFQAVQGSSEVQSLKPQCIALARGRAHDLDLERQFAFLHERCEVVDLERIEPASEQLGSLLGTEVATISDPPRLWTGH